MISNKLFSFENTFFENRPHLPSADITQIAELSIVRNGEMYEHEQYCDEITYVVSGKATAYYDGHTCELKKGQIHYIKQGSTHRIVVDSEQNFHYCCIGFIPNLQEESTRPFFETIRQLKEFVIMDDGSVQPIFNSLLDELLLYNAESITMLQCYFCQLIIKICRILNGNPHISSAKPVFNSSSQAAYQALKYIDKNYIKITTIKNIAKELSYSEYYLSHIFKEKTGITMKEYILKKKVMTSVELLKKSNMSISDISDHLNFSSLHSFGIAFKRYMNMSPSQFREMQKNQPL